LPDTGYEIYSEPQLREWWIKALAIGDRRFAAVCRQAILNKQHVDPDAEQLRLVDSKERYEVKE
jgi:hypothetical protein